MFARDLGSRPPLVRPRLVVETRLLSLFNFYNRGGTGYTRYVPHHVCHVHHHVPLRPTFTKYNPKLGFGRWTRAARRMGAVDKGVDMDSVTDRKGKLDTKVADDLLMDASVLQLMENPKVAGAIARLKEEPGCFAQMCADDPELGALPM